MDSCSVITCNNHGINIKKKESDASRDLTEEECKIIDTRSEILLGNHIIKLSKLSLMSLFEAIEIMTKGANLIRRMSVARRWLHVDFLEKVPIKKCIFHIHLKWRPMANRDNIK